MRPYLLAALILLTIPSSAHAQGLRADMRESIACTMDAKICPDGSAVSRTGPNCEFAPCPGETGFTPPEETYPVEEDAIAPAGVIEGTIGGVANPALSSEGPPMLPDIPLQDGVQEPVTVQFLVEHRSALNEKKIKVHGIIVSTLLADKACGNGSTMRMCAQPRITLADTAQDTRDMSYDLTILLPETDKTPYATGQILDVSGTVMGSGYSVVMMKE